MTQETLAREIEAIQKHFAFLFVSGFKIGSIKRAPHFPAWAVHIDSEQLRLIVSQDRGDTGLSVGPSSAALTGWPGNEYFGLEIVLVYLTGDHSYYPYLLQGVNSLDAQLAKLAAITETHWHAVSTLFGKEYSSSKGKEMSLLAEQLLEEKFHPVKPDYPQLVLDLAEILRALAASRSVQKSIFPRHVSTEEELRTLFEHYYSYAETLAKKQFISEPCLHSVEKIHNKFREMSLNNVKDWETIRLLAGEALVCLGKEYQPPSINQDKVKRRVLAYGSTFERVRLRLVNVLLIFAVSISMANYIYSLAEVGLGSFQLVPLAPVFLTMGAGFALLHGRALLMTRPIYQVRRATSIALALAWLFHVSVFYLSGLMDIDWKRSFMHILLFLTPFVVLLIVTVVMAALRKADTPSVSF